MELNVFTEPAVAGTLERNFVEARLHLETYEERGGEAWDAFATLRDEYARSVAMPTYAIVRPTDREQIGWYQLEGGPATWRDGILRFLRAAVDARVGSARTR